MINFLFFSVSVFTSFTTVLAQGAGNCVPYSLPAVSALQAAGAYPPIWQIANLSRATAADKALFARLNSTIPSILPKGTSSGNFTGVVYNGVLDPDCWWSYKQCTTPKLSGLQADITRCAEPQSWGFTLDDGPNCSHNAYYDYLLSVKQKATLFYIGSNVLDWPLEAQRGLNDGHEICAHSWSHRYMTALSNEEVFAELYYSKKAIKDVLGITVQCFRPPYGDVDDRVRYISQALGMSTVIWSDNTFDYLIATTNATYVESNYNAIFAKQAAGNYSTQGTIVLTHELNNATMTFSEMFLPKIQAQFAAIPIAVCNNNSNPYLEQTYTYPNFQQWISGTRSINVPTASAVSIDIPISFPLSTGTSTGSFFATIPYATGGATIGATSAATGAGGDSIVLATGTVTASASSVTAGSAATTSSRTTSGVGKLEGGNWMLMSLGLIAVGGMMV